MHYNQGQKRMLARLITGLMLGAACLFANGAHAQDGRWYRAESANFIVYGDVNEEQVRNAAVALEDFDATLRVLTRAPETAVSENKLEVYLVRGADGIQQVNPAMGDSVGGFYTSSFDAIAAFSRYDRDMATRRRAILFHEYAHHFMLHYFPNAYPRWYVEGWAEYVSTVEFRDRRAFVGRPSEERAGWIVSYGGLPIEQLLAPERVEDQRPSFSGQFYAVAWFAAMYVSNNAERLRGLERYVAMLGEGRDSIEAFEPAFGITPDQFAEELDAFQRGQTRLLSLALPATPPTITVTRMPRWSNDLLLPLMRLRTNGREVNDRDAEAITRAASQALHEPMARIVLARLAMRRDDNALARTHLHALLAADENHAEGRYLLAKLILDSAEDAEPEVLDAATTEARRHLVRSFRQDPNYYPTLFLYAMTFADDDAPMTEEQMNVLDRALELAPQVDNIRFLLARELVYREEFDAALVMLRPVIYAPHGGESAQYARWLFDAARLREQPRGDWREYEGRPAN